MRRATDRLTVFAQFERHIGDDAGRLRDGQAVTGDDDNFFCIFERLCRAKVVCDQWRCVHGVIMCSMCAYDRITQQHRSRCAHECPSLRPRRGRRWWSRTLRGGRSVASDSWQHTSRGSERHHWSQSTRLVTRGSVSVHVQISEGASTVRMKGRVPTHQRW
jgi:hypothetical protein